MTRLRFRSFTNKKERTGVVTIFASIDLRSRTWGLGYEFCVEIRGLLLSRC